MTGRRQTNTLRQRHRLDVVSVLRRDGPSSRAEIMERTGLSRATVSGLVGDLIDSGILVERDEDGPRNGRPIGRRPSVLTLASGAGSALGVDLGHTHFRVAVAGLGGEVLAERHHEFDVDRSAAETLDQVTASIHEALGDAGIALEDLTGVGMGLPGPIDRRTGIVGSSVILPGWAGVRPAAELHERLGIPVEADNDANLGALGEVAFGAARGARDVVYVKLSSGVGAGLIIDGRLHHGARGVAGELGHVAVDPAGPICRCGNRGCLETRAAAPALLELLRPRYGDLTVEGLVKLALDGDVGCRRVLGDAGRLVGAALADLCNVLNPEAIIVGGELSRGGEALLDGVREAIRRSALPAAAESVDVRAGSLGPRAEVLGALALIIRDTTRVSPSLSAA